MQAVVHPGVSAMRMVRHHGTGSGSSAAGCASPLHSRVALGPRLPPDRSLLP